MDLKENWADIQALFKKTKSYSIATVNEDGSPHITPIGALCLRNDQTGFYFEEFSQKMPKNFDHNNRICIMAVEHGFLFWMKSIFKGLCPSAPGVRLYGTVGERRIGSEEEIASFQDRVKIFRKRKGHEILWKNMKYLREIKFDSFEPVNFGPMTQHLWKD
jgi:hypothetical protein